MKSFLKVIGTGTGDSTPSFLLFFDQQRYLFNCGEGLQRLFTQHKFRFGKLGHIFLTQLSWESFGGLPGAILTVSDQGFPGFELWGPYGLHHVVHSLRSFVMRPNFVVTLKEIAEDDVREFKDENITMKLVKIISTQTSNKGSVEKPKISKKGFFSPAVNDVLKNSFEAIMSKQKESLNSGPGKYSVDKSNALGVPINQRRKLIDGESIVLENGTVVKPSDVILPQKPGKVFVVYACPSTDYIPDLELKKNLFHINGVEADLVIHITPEHVMKDPRYLAIVAQHRGSQHMCIHESLSDKPFIFPDFENYHHEKFDKIDTLIHTPLWSDVSPLKAKEDIIPNEKLKIAKTSTIFHFEPKVYLDESEEVQGKQLKLANMLDNILLNLDQKESVVTFFGTGSCIPSKYRNVTSIYVRIKSFEFLFDCGEGTLGQMVRHFGCSRKSALLSPSNDIKVEFSQLEGVDKKLLSIRCIFITHMHADHHLGLIRIISNRQKVLKLLVNPSEIPKLTIVGPGQLKTWLDQFNLVIDYSNIYEFIDVNQFVQNNNSCSTSGLSIDAIKAIHCPSSYSYIISVEDSIKIAFSGDSRPNPEFSKAAKGADLLIHEATFENSLQDHAIKKGHSTIQEAFDVANEMNAKYLILTHFSQRYQKVHDTYKLLDSTNTFDIPYFLASDLTTWNSDLLINERNVELHRKIRSFIDEKEKEKSINSQIPVQNDNKNKKLKKTQTVLQ
ncbi:Beta-lactamase superfamily domain-containing protein [Rozella allomycis CSF55]|uniref:ribonuclease Z n=1 Tax=Rozella allomycis (strain CSF55) TaxID=988480 RepID=A0A075B3V2_ROZAC|nr:Beta-lactamase superfamily domain-containing protein [Rozella allomycis CSF55]|eukprot:EPZ35802.1 Beta-lactamase superfamily domain-containing protein [Rozella allomycis CSF55]